MGLWDFGTLLCFQLIICPLLQLALETKCWVGSLLVLLTYCVPLLDLDTSHRLPHVGGSLRRVRSDLQRRVL